MYKNVNTKLNFVEREAETLKFWRESEIFKKSVEARKGGASFTFYEGPPTANGLPHVGHILTRAVKDIIPRYKTMQGYNVLRKAGWDTHGLPVELAIEKELGINGKPEIEKHGIESFVDKCKKSVWKYEGIWQDMSEKVGFFVDMKDPYVTYENNYIESVWWALKEMWNKDLIYKGHKVVPYCPRCGTSLSSHEVAQGYKETKDLSAVAKFKLKNKENEYFLAWTTTPWTLPSNVSLTVNGNENYSKVKVEDEIYILATDLVEKVLGEEAKSLETFKGKDLEFEEYEPLFDYAKIGKHEKAYYVTCDDYVTLSDGTGIVHSAPAFGEDDARIGKKYNLPFVQLVDEEGKFKEETEKFKGIFVKDADLEIVKHLKLENKLFKSEKYTHNYPFCWRCDTALLYYGRQSWFIEMTKVKEDLVRNNDTVNWMPETIKKGRFGNFLDNVVDWSISRERYWGTPLPIWECECSHRHMIGSVEELKNMAINLEGELDLHKPYIDKVKLKCPKCSKEMRRVSEVIDAWFDSGSMPFAQWHYPFENKDIFDKNFPANFISEGIDQTRGWFYTLMAISTVLFNKAPYKNVMVLGHVQDKEGKKMSKSKGNVVDPFEILETHGADAIRWYFYSNSSPWLPSKYSDASVEEGQRKFMGTLWNTYAFYILYANIDKFDPTKYTLNKETLNEMDSWILSKLNTVIEFVTDSLDNYKLVEPSRKMIEFVDDLSNWYVRRSRTRFWAKGMEEDKINAYLTLYKCLTEISKLSAPFIPFMTEEIYRNLVLSVDKSQEESIHLTKYPISDKQYINKKLESDMEKVLRIVLAGRTARSTANIKNRQPIGEMYIKSEEKLSGKYLDIIKDELNIKEIKFVEDTSKYTSYSFKPQLKTLGPKYGKLLGKISKYLKEQEGNSFKEKLDTQGVRFDLEGTQVRLTKEDVLVEVTQLEGYMAQSNKGVTVVLKTKLTNELVEEGFTREVISKIQTMRKELDFNVLDKIKISFSNNSKIEDIIKRNEKVIMKETLAEEVLYNEQLSNNKEWDINGENLKIDIEVK